MNKFLCKASLGVAVAGTIFAAVSANAVTDTGVASVRILDPITVTANNDMNFGTVLKPQTVSETVIVDNTGGLTGTATRLAGGAPGSAGTVDITGTNINTVSISVTDDANVAGLSFTSFVGKFGAATVDVAGGGGITLPTGSDTLTLGTTLNIAPTVTTGDLSPSYQVDVAYD